MSLVKLVGKRLTLTELTTSDLPNLLEWHNSQIFQQNCLPFMKEYCLEDLHTEILKAHQFDRHIQFIARSRNNNMPIGTIWVYRYSKINQTAYVTTFIEESSRKSYFYGIEMFILCCSYVFENLSCRKIYLEVHSDNKQSVNIFKKLELSIESTLLNHIKISEFVFKDLLVYALYKEEFNTSLYVKRLRSD